MGWSCCTANPAAAVHSTALNPHSPLSVSLSRPNIKSPAPGHPPSRHQLLLVVSVLHLFLHQAGRLLFSYSEARLYNTDNTLTNTVDVDSESLLTAVATGSILRPRGSALVLRHPQHVSECPGISSLRTWRGQGEQGIAGGYRPGLTPESRTVTPRYSRDTAIDTVRRHSCPVLVPPSAESPNLRTLKRPHDRRQATRASSARPCCRRRRRRR